MKIQLKRLVVGKAILQVTVQIAEAAILIILRVVPDLLIIVLEVEDLETLLEHITEIDVFGFAKAVIQIFLKKEKSKKKKRKK